MIGFPEPYGPADAGVMFTTYHCIQNEHGNTVEAEEVPCEVTPYGSAIPYKSFSPAGFPKGPKIFQKTIDNSDTCVLL